MNIDVFLSIQAIKLPAPIPKHDSRNPPRPQSRRISPAKLSTGHRFSIVLSVCVILAAASGPVFSDEPLSARIDALIEMQHEGPVAPTTDDAEFVRRVYLDFAGRIPTSEETESFLNDAAPDKRDVLIDTLLASDDYPARISDAMHVMLMERMGDHEEWRNFLTGSFRENRPWNEIVRDILRPDPENEQTRGSAFFITKRLEKYGQNPVDLPGLTRDVGRLFLGVDLQCAQCHDHLFVGDYAQADFQGLFAFVGHTTIRQDTDFPAVAESLVNEKTEFMSVFIQEPRSTGPRLPGGDEVEVVTFESGEEYVQPPDRQTRFPGIPKFSPLTILSEQLPIAENSAFCRNSVNRFWFVLMGRGLVDPLDLQHSENAPSHPELLDLLAREFVAHEFDVKWLLGELARTRVYQRSSRMAGVAQAPVDRFQVALERPLSSEQLLASMLVATRHTPQAAAVEGEVDTPEDDVDPLAEARETFHAAFAGVPREPELEFAPSVKAALFLLNDPLVLSWLQPAPGSLVETAASLEGAEVADTVYLSVLSRRPSDEERDEVVEILASAGDERAETIGHLAWALLASTEFCLNH